MDGPPTRPQGLRFGLRPRGLAGGRGRTLLIFLLFFSCHTP